MSATLPHLGIRINTDPTSPANGIVATYDFGFDSPQNFNPGRQQTKLICKDRPESYGLITETVSPTAPRSLASKGLGQKMVWDIYVEWEIGNPPSTNNTFEKMIGSTEANGWAIVQAFGIGQSVSADGISKYFWLTPNLNWGNPAEQWVRVSPKASPVMVEGSVKGFTTALQMTVETAETYSTVGARTYARRGFVYAGAGTITKNATTAVTGSGTAFLTDFIKGDYLESSAGVRYGRVLSVQTNTAMTLDLYDTGTLSGVAYQVHQRSYSNLLVPIYSFTEFTP